MIVNDSWDQGTITNYQPFEYTFYLSVVGDAVAYWLAGWTPDREVRVRGLAGSLRCVLGQDTLLSQCLSLPRSIK